MPTPLDPAVEAWLGSLHVRPATLRAYRSGLQKFTNWCGELGVDIFDITPDHIARYRLHQQQLNPAKSTLVSRLSSVRYFYTWLHGQGRIAANPSPDMEPYDRSGRQRFARQVLSLGDVRQLLEVTTEPRLRALILLLVVSGLTGQEILGAKVTDLSQTWRGWELRRQARGISAPLPTLVSGPLLEAVGERRHGPLFVNRWGNALDRKQLTNAVTSCGRQAKLGVDINAAMLVATCRRLAKSEPIPMVAVIQAIGEGAVNSMIASVRGMPDADPPMAYRLAVLVAPTADTTEGHLDVADSMAWTKSLPPAARVMYAASAFERHLRTLAIERGLLPPDIDRTTIGSLGGVLRGGDVLTNTDVQICASIMASRDLAAHGWFDQVTDDLAAHTIEQIRRLVLSCPLAS